MYTGALPTTSVHGTWIENLEIVSVDDGELFDLSTVTEITLRVRDYETRFDVLVLTMTNGDITIPSDGVIEWRAEVGRMGGLLPKVYEVIMTAEDETDTVPLILGSIAIVR